MSRSAAHCNPSAASPDRTPNTGPRHHPLHTSQPGLVYTLHLVVCNGNFTKSSTTRIKRAVKELHCRGLRLAEEFARLARRCVETQLIHRACTMGRWKTVSWRNSGKAKRHEGT